MEGLATSFTTSVPLKCWTCPVFDSLFVIISNSAAAAYEQLSLIGLIIFAILFAFYGINALWKNIQGGMSDPFFQKSLRPVLIKSLLALSLLGMGLAVPKLISQVTFEPAAEMALQYTKSMIPSEVATPEKYEPIKLDDSGFFNPELRDTIVTLLESSITNFQVYVKIGFAVISEAFSIKALLGIGAFVRHLIVFFMGLFLTYKFAKLFIMYSFYFIDIIVAMAMFGFFFPLSIVLFIFRNASDLPEWMKGLGKNLGEQQIKKLINAIVSVAAAILTYTIIMLIIQGFLDSNGVDTESLINSSKSFFDFDLENSTAMQITFTGAIVLLYVVEFLANQINGITEKIMSVFGVSKEDKLSKEMGENVLALTGIAWDSAKKLAKTVINPEKAKEEDKKEDKSEKAESK